MQVGDALLLISFKAAAEAQWQHSIFYLHWKGSTWVFIAIDVAPPPKLISLLKEKLKWGELHEPEESKEEELHMIVIQSFSAILLSWQNMSSVRPVTQPYSSQVWKGAHLSKVACMQCPHPYCVPSKFVLKTKKQGIDGAISSTAPELSASPSQVRSSPMRTH